MKSDPRLPTYKPTWEPPAYPYPCGYDPRGHKLREVTAHWRTCPPRALQGNGGKLGAAQEVADEEFLVTITPTYCACGRTGSRRAIERHHRECDYYRAVRLIVTRRRWHKQHDMDGWRKRRVEYLRLKRASAGG
jgi:hypothetical protein